MAKSTRNSQELPHGNSSFPTTHWSMVVRAGDRASSKADEALSALCRIYWYPIYAYIRRRISSTDQAEDLTQEFFAHFLHKQSVAVADRSRGKFRTFLLTCCQHFLANERERSGAAKRGGGRPILSFDLLAAEERYLQEPAHGDTAEKLFDRSWALTLLEQVLEQLGGEYQAKGQGGLFERLRIMLTGGPDRDSYSQISHDLGMAEAALRKAAQRMRRRYREILREQIGATVANAGDVDDEIRQLFEVLAG